MAATVAATEAATVAATVAAMVGAKVQVKEGDVVVVEVVLLPVKGTSHPLRAKTPLSSKPRS